MIQFLENQRTFYRDRPTLREANSSLSFLISRLYEEVEELRNASTNGLDLEKHQEQELVDIILFAIAALDVLMGDPEGAIVEKQAKTLLKYRPEHFQQGIPFEEGIRRSKAQAERERLDEYFYQDLLRERENI